LGVDPHFPRRQLMDCDFDAFEDDDEAIGLMEFA
jgi:hypothetical protein